MTQVQVLAVLAVLAVLLFPGLGSAVTWHFLRYYPPSSAKFTHFSGQMVVPPLPRAATYYLWPGLQPTDNTGVYQNVLDGRKGNWWFGSGWCCHNPDLPWGSGFNTNAGEMNNFTNALSADGASWTTTTTRLSSGTTTTNTFPLGN